MRRFNSVLFATLFSGVLSFSFVHSTQNDRCNDQESECQEKCECKCNNGSGPCGYNPLCRYYPYRTIYQHSCVKDENGDEPATSWPGRRDGNFSDEFGR